MANDNEPSILNEFKILFIDHVIIQRIGIVSLATATFGVFLSFAFSTRRFLQKTLGVHPIEVEFKDYFGELFKLYHNEFSLSILFTFLISVFFLVFTRDYFYTAARIVGKWFGIQLGHSHTVSGAGDPFDIDYIFSVPFLNLRYVSIGLLQTLLSFSFFPIFNALLSSMSVPIIECLLLYVTALLFWLMFYGLRLSFRGAIKQKHYRNHFVSAICLDFPVMTIFCYIPLALAIHLHYK